MPSIQEGAATASRRAAPAQDQSTLDPAAANTTPARPRGLSDLRAAGSGIQAAFGAANAARQNRGLSRIRSNTVRSRPATSADDEYNDDVMGLLDLVGKLASSDQTECHVDHL